MCGKFSFKAFCYNAQFFQKLFKIIELFSFNFEVLSAKYEFFKSFQDMFMLNNKVDRQKEKSYNGNVIAEDLSIMKFFIPWMESVFNSMTPNFKINCCVSSCKFIFCSTVLSIPVRNS